MSIVIVNQQRLLWNVYYVATTAVRKQINFQSAVLRSERSCLYCSASSMCLSSFLFSFFSLNSFMMKIHIIE